MKARDHKRRVGWHPGFDVLTTYRAGLGHEVRGEDFGKGGLEEIISFKDVDFEMLLRTAKNIIKFLFG